MALAETSSFLQLYVYFTLADPAMPFSPTFVAAGYPLCKPFAVVHDSKTWRCYLEGPQFTVVTDHSPLIMHLPIQRKLSRRQVR